MLDPINKESLESILKLINKDKLRDAKNHAKSMIIHENEFIALILLAQRSSYEDFNFGHRMFCWETLPQNIDIDISKIDDPVESKKILKQLLHIYRVRKWTVGHQFYTPCKKYWHFFYFDLNDILNKNNQWQGGNHVHYISDLWPQYKCDDVWQKFINKSKDFGASCHIRYKASDT